MSALLIILALLLVADLLTLLAVARAPRGSEDERGFHVITSEQMIRSPFCRSGPMRRI